MKRIETIIQPSKLDEVKEALADAGIKGITVVRVKASVEPGAEKRCTAGRRTSSTSCPRSKSRWWRPTTWWPASLMWSGKQPALADRGREDFPDGHPGGREDRNGRAGPRGRLRSWVSLNFPACGPSFRRLPGW